MSQAFHPARMDIKQTFTAIPEGDDKEIVCAAIKQLLPSDLGALVCFANFCLDRDIDNIWLTFGKNRPFEKNRLPGKLPAKCIPATS
jgi:hypothetical protein